MKQTQTSAPVALPDRPARRTTDPVETERHQSNPLPESVTSDPRWRRVWAILLAPIEDDEIGEAA